VALSLTEASLARASEQGLPYWEARGRVMRGLLLAKLGQTQEGIAEMRLGLEAMRTTGAELNRVYFPSPPCRGIRTGGTVRGRARRCERSFRARGNASWLVPPFFGIGAGRGFRLYLS
jgi:hypothetical protein